MIRIGIMGGTFDPPHLGHLIVAEQARVALDLKKVIFIPAGNPVFKKDQYVTPAHDRLRMCEMATDSNPAFEVSNMEIARGGDTYSVDTLRELCTTYTRGVEFWTIVGSDVFSEMQKWYKADEIAKMSHIAVLVRPTTDVEALKERKDLSMFQAEYIPVTQVDISSTDIRQRVKDNKTIRYLVTERVRQYIKNHHLYQGSH